jgi:transcriptional enhancer factor
MDVALNLMETHAQEGADLVTQSEMSVTGGSSDNYEWQTVTSLIMPPELCRGSSAEQLLEANVTPTKILFTNASETRLKVRFPAEEWAHILTRLTDIQLKYEGSERCETFGGECFINAGQPAEKYLQQVSMYQEVQSCSGPGMPFIRRAIIIWTFRAAMAGEKAETTWRYVDATPSPSGMSPSSISSHQLSASTTDNFNAWVNSPSELPIQRPDALDPYMRGLVTQPSAAEFRSTFAAENYGYHDKQFTVPLENFSFEPITRADGEPSLINNNITTNIGACLSNSTNMSVDSFDHSPPDWNIPPSGLLNAGPSWPGYAAIPSNAPNIDVESGATNNSWHFEMDPRLAQWTEYKDGTGGWAETDPAKQKPMYIEQTDDKLLSWLDPPSNETKDVYIEAEDVQLPILPPGLTDMKGSSWMDSDSNFDFNQLVDRLRG